MPKLTDSSEHGKYIHHWNVYPTSELCKKSLLALFSLKIRMAGNNTINDNLMKYHGITLTTKTEYLYNNT